MKKYLLYSLVGAAALAMGACNEDFNEDVAEPQSWPQEEAITIPGFSASAAAAADLATAGEMVTVFSYSQPNCMPEGTTIDNFRLDITPADIEGAQTTKLTATTDGQVVTAELQALIEEAYGKRPVERTLNAKVYANFIKDGQASLLTCDPIVIKATPKAPVIDNGYFLVGDMFTVKDADGNEVLNGWTAEAATAFNHSGADVYEDPIFTLMFTTTKENSYWKIIPKSNYDGGNIWADGVVGVVEDGDPSLEGKLVNVGANAGKIEKMGMYIMTLNMMDYTYSIKEVAPEYYVIGAMQGWNNSATGMTNMLYPTTPMIQSYTTKWVDDHNFKLILGSDIGNWDACFGATYDGCSEVAAALASTGAGAIVCPEKDVYYTFTANFSTMSYEWTKLDNQEPTEYKKIGLIGDFNGWGADFELTQLEKAPHNWICTFSVDGDSMIKFRADADWAVNWGAGEYDGAIDLSIQNSETGVQNGKNLKIHAGTYNVFFNDITGQFVFKAVE